MTPTPGGHACLSLRKVCCGMLVAAGATAQLCRQGGVPLLWESPDPAAAAAGQMPLLPTTCAAGVIPLQEVWP